MKKNSDAVLSPVRYRGMRSSIPLKSRILKSCLYVMAIGLITLVAWFRLPEISRGTLWAEDASVFLRETISIGPWLSIGEPYAGYLHTIPRIVSAIAYSVAPIESYAWLMSFISCAVVASISVACYVLSGQMFHQRSYRLMVALVPVLVPIGPLEVLGNAANLHWYLLWLCPWLLIFEPRGWFGRSVLFLAALLAATTEIISGIFLPLAIWAIVRRRNYWAPAGFIVGLGFQFLATVLNPRYSEAPRLDAIEPLSVVYGFLLQAVGSLWETDSTAMGKNVVSYGGFAVVIPALIVFALLAFVLVFGDKKWRAIALYSFGAAVACWTAAILLNPTPEADFANFTEEDWLSTFTFFRYAAAPSMFLLVLLPIACAVAEGRGLIAANRTRYWAPVAMALFISTSYLQASSHRQSGPEWAPGVRIAKEQCMGDPSLPQTVIAVAPGPWQVDVPCAVLAGR